MDPLLQLAEILDPVALCDYIGKKTRYGKKCDHSFKHAQAFLKEYPSADWDQVRPLLESLGAHCDCEIGFNVCTRTDELPEEVEERYGYTSGS